MGVFFKKMRQKSVKEASGMRQEHGLRTAAEALGKAIAVGGPDNDEDIYSWEDGIELNR